MHQSLIPDGVGVEGANMRQGFHKADRRQPTPPEAAGTPGDRSRRRARQLLAANSCSGVRARQPDAACAAVLLKEDGIYAMCSPLDRSRSLREAPSLVAKADAGAIETAGERRSIGTGS